ncbi:Bax inhibitor-1/YccA family protein [Niabella beijingensis]|uniref:Bax inhibitor-1/YccA family protein n=1 Tax=Niabella beijingensis TaxID=2872700 RepID=UPI001CC08694|nr:Bax inhibitor-1/YccA family protein [Niabella beijingensis]MBZ4191790.1 Bax inhibitor-1/YccA family protein [Niabella beijingensis]
MEDNYSRSTPDSIFSRNEAVGSKSRSFLANVFTYMFVALGITAVVAYLFAGNEALLYPIISNKLLLYATIFAPLGFVLLMSFAFNRLSAPVLMALLLIYSAINGISFSFILLVYTSTSVFGCFLTAALMFGVMAVMGYTTKQDLTSMGRIMMMGLIGIIIASIVNWFLKSDSMSYIISFIGVIVFTGLTAYDVQKLKRIGEGIDQEGNVIAGDAKKLAIMGALSLYLDFINLFLMLLRLFGRRN